VVLADSFTTVLTIAKELAGDPAVKQAIADDIALVESKATEGAEALEAHVAGWFAAHYALPAPEAATPAMPVPAEPAAAVTEQAPAAPDAAIF
jgi:hypothetical protein